MGRRILATVALNPNAVAHMLNASAKPFFPDSLRSLFNRSLNPRALRCHALSPLAVFLTPQQRLQWRPEMQVGLDSFRV